MKPILGTQLDLKHPLNKGLVGCWLFNERSGRIINDISASKFTGILNSSSPVWGPSELGGILNVDDVTYANISTPVNFGTKSISCRAILKPSTFIAGNNYIVYAGASGANPVITFHLELGGEIAGIIEGTNASQVSSTLDGAQLSTDIWHDIWLVCDRENGAMARYIDGHQTGTIDDITGVTGPVSSLGGGWWINAGSGGEHFRGQLSEVRIYNRALSAAEIKELYLAKFKPVS